MRQLHRVREDSWDAEVVCICNKEIAEAICAELNRLGKQKFVVDEAPIIIDDTADIQIFKLWSVWLNRSGEEQKRSVDLGWSFTEADFVKTSYRSRNGVIIGYSRVSYEAALAAAKTEYVRLNSKVSLVGRSYQ